MTRLHIIGLCLAALAVGACSKPTPPQTAGVQDPSKPANPVEEQRLRDEANRNYYRPNYQPAERKSYTP